MSQAPNDTPPNPPALQAGENPKSVCLHCRDIFASPEAASTLVAGETVQSHRGQQSIRKTAREGCRLCRVLLCLSHGEGPGDQQPERNQGQPEWEMDPELDILGSEEEILQYNFVLEKQIRIPEYDSKVQVIKVSRMRMGKPDRYGYVSISAQRDDPAAKLISNRSVCTKVNSPEVFSRIRQWLTECHATHKQCNQCLLGSDKAHASPLYLLDVSSDNGKVFLNTREMVEKTLKHRSETTLSYAALSYAWGTEQPHATTKSNLTAHLQGIQISTLPRTIRDAITVVKSLGVAFLWVDSLCIVQDDPSEKARELGIMGAVYHNAYVVISAASARTCEDGFLEDRSQPAEYIQVPFGSDGFVDLSHSRGKNGDTGTFGAAPLDNRAWAYQEFYMARRLVVFHVHEILWTCSRAGGDGAGRRCRVQAINCLNDSCRTDQYPEPRDWGFIMASYSRRQMTYDSDKLPAVSSIAELFAGLNKEPYLAGLWPGALGQLLSWFPLRTWRYGESNRPAEWRAPSWSFFSVNAPIGFLSIDGTDTISERRNLGWALLSAYIKPVSRDAPFGEVADAELHLRGRLMSLTVGKKTEADFAFTLEVAPGEHESALTASAVEWTMCFDAMEPAREAGGTSIASCYGEVSVTDQLWWFVMWGARESTNQTTPWDPAFEHRERFWGLGLAQLPNGTYHRVGCIIVVGKTGESLGKRLQSLPLQDFTLA